MNQDVSGSKHALGIAALCVASALWSINGPLIKYLNAAPAEGATALAVPGVAIACFRSLFGGLFMLWPARGGWARLREVHPVWPILSVVMLTALASTFVIASTMTAASNAIILQYTAPAWVFVLSPFVLREKPRAAEAGLLAIAMVGVAVIFFGNPGGESRALQIALSSGLFFAVLQLVLKRLANTRPATIVAMNLLGCGILLLPAVAIWGHFHYTPGQWGLLVGMGVVQFSLPYLMFSWALKYVAAHHAALITLLEAILNPAWTWLFIGEPVPPATMIGGPIILVSVIGWIVLSVRGTSRRRKMMNEERETR